MQATIHNEYLTLTVDTHGAEAVSLKNAAGEELLWQADPAVWKRHAPILFPWTGKLKDGSFTHGGKTYKGGQHGFARDVEHTLLKAEGDTVQLELRPDETMKAERFPFDFVLTSTFRLDGKTLHHTLTVSNPGSEELRFGIGYHPAFCVPFDDRAHRRGLRVPLRPAREPGHPRRQRGRPADGQMLLPVEEPAGHPADQRPLRQRQLLHGRPAHQDAGHLREGHWAAASSAMWPASPIPSSGRPCPSRCALSASSRGTRCPPRWTIRRSGSQRAAAACLAPGEEWSTTLSTTFNR